MSLLEAPADGSGQRADGDITRSVLHRRRVLTAAAVVAIYTAVSVVVWWQVWSGHPTAAMTCGCGDPSLFVSSFSWVAHALAHGHNPFLSTATFHPGGINLLANTSGMLEAVLLAPVTWLFGPIASLNVANTLAPAVSAMATYWAVRRSLGTGRLGALVAGLVVELSPAVVGSSALSHLQVSLLAFVPIIGVCLHELLARQSGRPWGWGALLAAAAVGQFFAGTEVFVIVALLSALVVAVAALALLVRVIRGSRTAGARARYATRGLATGSVIAGVVLAGPAWFALAGPRHYTGVPWPGLMALAGAGLDATISAPSTQAGDVLIRISGYLGPVGAPGNYLGLGAVLAAFAAVIVLWRRPAVWALAALAFVSGWLALGAIWTPFGSTRPAWVPFLPWATLGHLPLLRNMLAQNFVVVTVVAVAALVGLLVDWIVRRGRGPWRLAAVGLALALSAGALFPLVTAWPLPLTAKAVQPPSWFVRDAPKLPTGSVVLAYPFAGPAGDGEAAVWQAMVGMNFSLAGGFGLTPGPDGSVDHGTRPGSASAILGALSSPVNGPLPTMIDTAAMATVREAMATWGVTTVVITDRGRDQAYATQWFTALLGRPPSVEDGSHVWTLDAPHPG